MVAAEKPIFFFSSKYIRNFKRRVCTASIQMARDFDRTSFRENVGPVISENVTIPRKRQASESAAVLFYNGFRSKSSPRPTDETDHWYRMTRFLMIELATIAPSGGGQPDSECAAVRQLRPSRTCKSSRRGAAGIRSVNFTQAVQVAQWSHRHWQIQESRAAGANNS